MLQNTDKPVNAIKKGGVKEGGKNALHSTFMHPLSYQVELYYLGVLYES